MSNTFLKAEWRKLVMANYVVDRDILLPYLPYKTELDLWNDTCYVSLVGFMFLNTEVIGIQFPFHTHFEEVNLRFYVKYKSGGQWQRGVVFIKEIVSRPLLSFVANTLYSEHYETLPTQHRWEYKNENLSVEYKWLKNKHWNSIRIDVDTIMMDIEEGSEEEFITEHYWGYTKVNERKTSAYAVEHPRWQVYRTIDYAIKTDFAAVYGSDFASLTNTKPKSVFLADGSVIEVKKGRTL